MDMQMTIQTDQVESLIPLAKDHFKNFKRVLVVDDDVEMAMLMTRQLRIENCRVEYCMDGYDALENLVNHQYDLIFMDWSLPGLNGGEVLKKIDESINRDPLIGEKWGVLKRPVVMVSAYEYEKLQLPFVENFKVVDFWEKKMGPAALKSHIHDILNRSFYII